MPVYSTALGGFLRAEIAWTTATIKAALVRGYTYTDSHSVVSDVTGAGGVLAATTTLPSTSTTGGQGLAGTTTFPLVSATGPVSGVLVFQASAVSGGADVPASSQRVISWHPVSVTPDGGDVIVTWSGAVVSI